MCDQRGLGEFTGSAVAAEWGDYAIVVTRVLSESQHNA